MSGILITAQEVNKFIEIASLCPKTIVLSCQACVSFPFRKDLDAQLLVSDLEDWESKYGRIPEGAIVIMKSGHGARNHKNKTAYFGTPANHFVDHPKDFSEFHFPGFHQDAAKWLAENRDIYGVGVDTIALDYGPSQGLEAHQELFNKNIWGLENLNNVDKLPPNGELLFVDKL